MASGDVLLDASGNEILEADGDAQLSDGAGDSCCCNDPCSCATGTACNNCSPDCTPTVYRVVISGVTQTCCAGAGCPGSTGNGSAIGPDMNVTFDLPQTAACQWSLNQATRPFAVDGTVVYADCNCGLACTPTANPLDCDQDNLSIVLTKLASGKFSFAVTLNGVVNNLFSLGTSLSPFLAFTTTSVPCNAPFTMTNGGGGAATPCGGSGGTATFTPCP